MSIPRNVYIPLLAILLTLAVFLTTTVTEYKGGFDSDGLIYAKMALSPLFTPSDATPPPFCQRVLTPKLASLLPGSLLDRFRLIAFVANVISLCILYRTLILLGFSESLCYLGTLLYAGVFWTLKFSFYSPAYIDHVTQLLLLALIYSTIAGRFGVALVVLGLSAFQKELLPMFSLFVVVHLLSQKLGPRTMRTTFLAVATVGLPFMCLHFIQSRCCVGHQHVVLILLGEGRRFFHLGFWPIFIHAMFSGLGLLPVILLLQYRPWLMFLRQRPAFIVYLLVAGSALLGGYDKSRLFNYALPVVVFLALATIQSWQPVPSTRAILWAMMLLCGHWYVGNYLTPLGTFSSYLAKLVPEHAARMGGQSHVPFLIRDCISAVVLFVVTVQLMLGEWHFSPTSGFTRRDTARSAVSRG